MKIRLAAKKDVESILNIYKPEVLTGYASMEEELPDKNEMWERINTVLKTAPWLVAEIDGQIVGYAYTAIHNGRTGYRYTRQLSIYVHQEFQRRGIASALLDELIRILALQGYKKIISFIVLPNKTSEVLHEKYNFQKVGVFEDIAYKHNQWYSIGYYVREINSASPGTILDYNQFLKV